MSKYLIDLKELGNRSVSFEGSFERDAIDFRADDIRQLQVLNWSLSAERSGVEIRVVGEIETSVELTCSRCLEKLPYSISKEFELFFRQRHTLLYDEDAEIVLDERDTRTAFIAGSELAIGDILREQVLLALPMKPLCQLDCRGLCPSCGTNLNFSDCGCAKEQNNPAFDALLELKRRLEERSL